MYRKTAGILSKKTMKLTSGKFILLNCQQVGSTIFASVPFPGSELKTRSP